MKSRRTFIKSIGTATVAIPFLDPFNAPFFAASETAWQPPHLHHFPSRLYAFIFRTWDLQPVERIARFLKTDSRNISAIAKEMGLPPQPVFDEEIQMRNSMPTIFRLWEILPKEQLRNFMHLSDEEFYDYLHTDITYWHALGTQPEGLKPLNYTEPLPSERERAAELRQELFSTIPEDEIPPNEDSFGFIKHLNRIHTSPMSNRIASPAAGEILFDSRWKIAVPVDSGTLVRNAVADFEKFCASLWSRKLRRSRKANIPHSHSACR
jgi:hypothetical protein